MSNFAKCYKLTGNFLLIFREKLTSKRGRPVSRFYHYRALERLNVFNEFSQFVMVILKVSVYRIALFSLQLFNALSPH